LRNFAIQTSVRDPCRRRRPLTGKPDEIECNTKKVKGLVLKTAFLKKA